MQFAKVLQFSSEESVSVPEDWGQGRSVFGGIASAIAYQKALSILASTPSETARPIRSLCISFVGPIDASQPLLLSGEILRAGKSVAQVETKIHQDGECKLVMLASFGAARSSLVSVSADSAPKAPELDGCAVFPYIENVTPKFTRHFDYRYGWGGFPFTGNQSREMGGWIKYRQPEPEITSAHLLGLFDAWPPAVLPWLRKPAPGSSLTWMVDFVQPSPAVTSEEWLLYQATIQEASDGYGMIDARMWTESGELLAIGRQCVTVFG